jgi:5-methyltetrahydropteroyltriglutamate--homocysteine methyltransferase
LALGLDSPGPAVPREGVALAYEEAGSGGDLPFLFVHGMAATGATSLLKPSSSGGAIALFQHNVPRQELEDCRQWAARVEAINYSIRDIPSEKIRFHTCYSIDAGPRIHELELKDIIDIILKIKAGAYSFEAANPRHEREYHIFEHVKVPEGRILIPGVISHTTNLVEHPELIAERIERFARLVGRENVIAGADCRVALRRAVQRHAPQRRLAEVAALAEGARLATQRLWGRPVRG